MLDNQVQVKRKTYSLYPRQIAKIRGFAIAMTDGNESAALRQMLDEWETLRNNRLVDPPVPYVTIPSADATTSSDNSVAAQVEDHA